MAQARIRIEGMQAVVETDDDPDVADAVALLPRARRRRGAVHVALSDDVARCLLRLARDVRCDPPAMRLLTRLASRPARLPRPWVARIGERPHLVLPIAAGELLEAVDEVAEVCWHDLLDAGHVLYTRRAFGAISLGRERRKGTMAEQAQETVASEFDPFGDAYVRDPHAFFARARREAPVFFSEAFGAHVVPRYGDVRGVLEDPETFSAAPSIDFVTPPSEKAVAILAEAGYVPGPVTVNEDDPEHRIHRDVMVRAFSPERMAQLEPKIRAWVAGYVDAFADRGRADLVGDFMWEIPALAAFEIIGVPDAELDDVKQHAERRADLNFGCPSEAEQIDMATGFGEAWKWCVAHVDRLAEQPNATFMSEMVELSKRPEYAEVMDRTYAIRMCLNILFAGYETTTSGAANVFVALLGDREQWDRLVADPGLIDNAVDEALRVQPTTPLWQRRATRDTRLGGVEIPAGALIWASFASANRDEQRFPDAARLDICRSDADQHLTFGWGRHKCLGEGSARLQMQIAVAELARRVPHATLVPGQDFGYGRNIAFRGPTQVLVEWDPARNPAG